MNILYVASEATPFIKTGGLADVAGSLPYALQAQGHNVTVVMPFYSQIGQELKDKMIKIAEFYVDLQWRRQYAGVLEYKEEGLTYLFIDNKFYFDRHAIYGLGDDGERFVFFNKAVVQMIRKLDINLDIVHANDWHCGLVPLYIKDFAKGDNFYNTIKSVYTIHNLKYQGVFPASLLALTGLTIDYFNEEGLKFYDSINFMKAGIVYCDALTTVSQSYSEEIRYSFYGENLEGIIRKHEYKLSGIVNGIDYDVYNPKTDKRIPYNFDARALANKKKNKKELQKKFKLPQRDDVPLISMVSRLVAMKGLDLVRYILDELLQEDVQFVVLGTGDQEYENMFRGFQWKYPEKMSAHIYFDEDESHLVYAGSDLFLMPSLAEPCGISQLISLRYGTIPIVRETGGLRDTVIAYNKYTGEGNGFSFSNYNAHELLFAVKDALELYKDKTEFRKLMRAAMKADHSWKSSSQKYTELYKSIK